MALCRRHQDLRATVLDLPQAIEHAAPLLAAEGMGDRVVHRTSDALLDELGTGAYDIILVAQLLHHLNHIASRALVACAARALRPGGCLLILEAPRGDQGGQFGGLLNLYFAFTSRASTWSTKQLAAWQLGAGLVPRRPIRLCTLPHFAIQPAFKRID